VKGGATTTTAKGAATSSTLAGQAGGAGSARIAATTSTTSTTVASTSTTVAGSTATTIPGSLPSDNKDSQAVLAGRKDGLLYLVGPTAATGEIFNNNASAEISNGAWVVVANLKSGASGEDTWNKLATDCYNGTQTCPSKSIAIVLDGEVISAPVVQTPTFTGGNVQISGNFTETEANDLAKILQFGAVPVQFDTPTVQTVSATLGKDSLHAAIISGLIGVLLVLAFLLFYYRIIALVVVGGLGVSSLLLWSVISWLSKTNGLALTLSGAAGIIVSIGVTVDSYVVFFERLKDDVQHGRSLRNSAVRGFESAWRTILAADTVSLIGALVLWWLTVGSVRGFAFFLGLSTLSDIVVSYFFTRPAVLMLARTNFMNRGNVLGVARDDAKEVAE
jgi:preprotein translocase subunit SecD